MAVLDYKNVTDVTTEVRTPLGSLVSQASPLTRRLTIELITSEIETRAIEQNRELYTTVLERIGASFFREPKYPAFNTSAAVFSRVH